MPERVTKEERKISMAIEKARNAKEMLYQSLMDNNRSELKDESEAVKVTRPKAENVNLEMKPQGKHSGVGLDSHATAGDSLKKADRKILGYDVIYFKDGKRKVKSFRNQKIIPVRTGRGVKNMPDIQPAKLFASKNDANTIKTIYE